MSWSFNGVGTPSALKKAIDQAVEGYGPRDYPHGGTNHSRLEFEAAAVGVKQLLDTVAEHNVVALDASGHGSYSGAQMQDCITNVQFKTLGLLRT